MRRRILFLFISMILTAGQAVYFAACANANETPAQEIALIQPSPVQTNACKNASQEEPNLVEAENQIVPGVVIYASTFGGDEADRLAKDGVFIGSNSKDNYIELQGGNVLLNPEKDTVVGTRLGKIYIGSGASVFVVDSGDDVVVYDLLQTKPKQVAVVVVESNKHRLTMEPGRVLVLTGQNTHDFEQLAIDCHRVAYRNAQPINLDNPSGTVKAFAADFSIASAMVIIQPLRRWTVSNNKEDKLVMEKMLKGAVLLGDFATSPAPITPDSPTVTVKADSIQIAADSK